MATKSIYNKIRAYKIGSRNEMRANDEFYYRAYEEHMRATSPEFNGQGIPELIKLAENSCGHRTKILPCLFKCDDDIEVDVIYENSTGINILAKHITSENFYEVFNSIKQFMDYGASSNIPDEQEMTPISYILANNEIDDEKKKMIIEYLVNLEYPKVDIDTNIGRTNNLRKLLKRKFSDIQLPSNDTNELQFLILPKLLREKQENDFVQYFQNDRFVIRIPDDINQKKNYVLRLLKIAIKNGLNKAVEVLLERNFFDVEQAFDSGFKTACNVGNSQALKLLLEQYNSSLKNGRNLLVKIYEMLDKTNENNDYNGCLDILIDSSKLNANDRSFALHRAIQIKKEELIIKLFKKGANLLAKSLPYINPDILEKCFDKCITTNGLKRGERHFGIRINYNNFQKNSDVNQDIFSHKGREIMTIKGIAESKNLKHLLSHPLITSFLFLKWHKLSAFFYMNLLICFYIFLISCIFLDLNNANEAFQITFKILSSLGLVYLILHETIEFFTLRRIMFNTPFALIPNCIEVALIVSTILTLAHSNYQNEPQRSSAVYTILLASVEMYLLLGSLPILTFSTHMLMLNAVCVSFIKSLCQYAIFFVTFGLCFHITFRKTENSNNNNADTNPGHFDSAFGSIFKTFIMVTGEFDSGNIKFNSTTSYTIFILFVAFMSIILLNLLNGLAVSDTQMIRKQAELNDSICRTYLIVNLEKSLTVLKNIWVFNSIFNNFTTSVQEYIHGDYITIEIFNGNKITMKTDIQGYCIFFRPSNFFSCFCNCKTVFRLETSPMDLSITQAALSVLEKNHRIEEQEKSVLEQKNLLKDIKTKVEMMLPLLGKLAENVK